MRKTPPWLGAERGLKDMVVEHLNHNSRRGQRLVQGGNTSSLIASADLEQPMELRTRDAKDEVALAQLGAAVILLWHNVPKFMQADLLYVAETIGGVQTVPDARLRLQRLIKGHQLARE
jgi:hypothetical protein